jgi:hypothetical protein
MFYHPHLRGKRGAYTGLWSRERDRNPPKERDNDMVSGEQTLDNASAQDTAATSNAENKSGGTASERGRSISREQRSAAAKRGWITRKKRKP